MKQFNSKFLLLCIAALVFFSSSVLLADWIPGDGHKMHFPQLPDEDGWAVNATNPIYLAEDWRCSESGWVKDLHFWGAWKHGIEGQIGEFIIYIATDIPADQSPTGYSMPGDLLWLYESYDFQVTSIAPTTMEGWYDPNTGEISFYDHLNYYQYNIFLDEANWFYQNEGEVYWLLISAVVLDTGQEIQWGWKSSEDHFNDDATWIAPPYVDWDWKELYEPNYVDTGDFFIALDPSGQYVYGGGSGYVGLPSPISDPPWYYYEETGWWNQWYYDGVFDPNREKVGRIIIDVGPLELGLPSSIEVAVNWSTEEWSLQGYPEPPLPPVDEALYIGRKTLLLTDLQEPGTYVLDYVIPDYNPEWVSIDVRGYNFEIYNGMIEHSCVQSLDLAFVITGGPEEFDVDFGDAPQGPYPTKLDTNGANHIIAPGVMLGALIDGEPDGQPNSDATGDDLSNLADEDGVAFDPIMPGSSSTAYVTPSVTGFINAWMDFNADGDWDDPGEQIFTNYLVMGGAINNCPFAVPFGASPNKYTFTRFRYTTYAIAMPSYTGQELDGEVEDYKVYISENPDIKWIQLPDTSPNGIDIKVDDMRTIADDFNCTSLGYITDVHLWGSWKDDIIGNIENIHLSIHSDDPVGEGGSDPCNTYSKPDELLWEGDFSQNEFQVGAEIYLEDGEYWWDPVTTGDLKPEGDHEVWRIDIDIPKENAFLQEGSPDAPVIYWLDVRVDVDLSSGAEFGWKTRRYPEHFNDDAVINYGSELPYLWKELRYPPTHPYEPNSIDMAFVITGKEIKQPVPNLKWSQPPIEIDPSFDEPVYCGWNEESWVQEPFGPVPGNMAADDFPCLGTMPVTSIHLWGSFLGWTSRVPPPVMPTKWNIKFYSNVAAIAGADPNYSHPGVVLWDFNIPNDRVTTELVGWDEYYDMPFEACFQHNIELTPDEYFNQADYIDQTEDNIYWIGITAVYSNLVNVEYPWGWKTRPAHWMDDAVSYECRVVDPCNVECKFWPIEDPVFGESFDLAFELDTDPNYIKWDQPYTGIRHWPHYDDRLSMATEYQTSGIKYIQNPDLDITGMDVLAGPLSVDDTGQNVYEVFLADDFLCTQTGPITDIHLWVSYNQDIEITPTPLFSLVIYENIPAGDSKTGYSMPGEPVWDAYLRPTNQSPYATAQESFYDPNRGIIGHDNVVWKYDFDIEPADAFVQQEGRIYWLGVHHSFDLNGDGVVNIIDLAQLASTWPGVFGWKTSLEHFEDDAVWTKVMTFMSGGHVVPTGPWQELHYPPDHPLAGRSIDMAFEITTQQTGLNVQQKAADDWLCKRRTPVNALAWWGSYIGYRYLTPCTGTMTPYPPVPPDYFVITIHRDVPADDPANPWGFSHPGEKVWEYTAYNYEEVLVGYDKQPEGQIGPPREPVYRYSVKLPEDKWFKQRKYNEIYWISIMAVYKGDIVLNHQGWGWTIHKHVFNDDAVIAIPLTTMEGWEFEEIYDQEGNSADLSFTLFTDPDVCVTCADYNWSGLVEFKDFAVFALDWCWTGPAGGYANGDLDCNGKVNPADLKIFCDQWLQNCP